MTGVPPNGQHGPHVLVDRSRFPSSLTMIVITWPGAAAARR